MLLLALLVAAQDPFSITIDGKARKPRWISFEGEAKGPMAGDIIEATFDCWFPLGAERELRLRTTKGDDSRVLLESTGETVGVFVHWTRAEDGSLVFHSPLAKMSDEELRGIRGVALQNWTPEIARQLLRLNGPGVSLNFHLMAPIQTRLDLPELPAGLRHLRIWDGNRHLQSFAALKSLGELRALDLFVSSDLDLELLAGMKKLEWLKLWGSGVKNWGALRQLKSLRFLRIISFSEETDLSFTAELHNLEELHLAQNPVKDLRPLSGLKKLRLIQANGTKVECLPEGELPALRELRIQSTPVTETELAKFAQAHPQCRIDKDWNAALRQALEGATRLRIRDGGLCHRRGGEPTLFETKDAVVIRKFIERFEVVEKGSGFHCSCCGDPTLEFYRDEELKVELGFHHGRSLRWKGWFGDGLLTPASAEGLIDLLAAHGVSGPAKAEEAANEEARREAEQVRRALAGLSPAAVEAYWKGRKDFTAVLEKERPDPVVRAEALFRMLGTSTDSWWMQDPLEQAADELLSKMDAKVLFPAAHAALTGGDRALRRGAARLWIVGKSPLKDWAPPSGDPAWEAAITAQQEARHYPLRQEAMKNLVRWRKMLSPEIIAVRLRAGLRDPEPGVRRVALLAAGKLKHADSIPHLLSVLAGETVEPLPLPALPKEEERPREQGLDDYPKLPEAEYAALGLGWMEHAATREVLVAKAGTAASYDVALALLGEPERLTSAHFDRSSQHTELQLAAVEAVVRAKGRVALLEALRYESARFWWEPDIVMGRLKEMLIEADAPGMELLRGAKSLKDLLDWHKVHGDAYAKRFKKP